MTHAMPATYLMWRTKRALHCCILAAVIFVGWVQPATGQTFRNSIVSTAFDFITEDDPSTYSKLEFRRNAEAELPDKRDESAPLFKEAFVFLASFTDNTTVTIFVDAAVGSESAAREEALRYVHPLGKLPTALRQGVERLVVHTGGEETTAFSDIGLIVLYADNATVRIANHDLEETIFHESVHAAWDAAHAKSTAWKAAQAGDGAFATAYGKSNPELEDLAETALFAYTMLHHPDRLPDSVKDELASAIPARIQFIAEMLPPEQPIHFGVAADSIAMEIPELQTFCNVTLSGYAADIISHCLLTEFGADEKVIANAMGRSDARYESGEDVFRAAIKQFEIDPARLKRSVIQNLHENCDHPDDFDDTAIRDAVESWQAQG